MTNRKCARCNRVTEVPCEEGPCLYWQRKENLVTACAACSADGQTHVETRVWLRPPIDRRTQHEDVRTGDTKPGAE